jgi:hypothetical protein
LKIAYFDYWTRGLPNFLPLDANLKKLGHETMLLHIGSFRSPHPKEEHRMGVLTRDISFYGTKYIYDMLKAEKPDAIVSLNTTYILDRAMVLAARRLGIKTVYVMHGNKAWHEQTEARLKIVRASFNPLLRKLAKAGKYGAQVIPNYWHSFRRSGIGAPWYRPAQVVAKYFKDPGYCFYFPPFPEELLHDKCLVYSQSDVDYFRKLGYSDSSVFVTGSPKLDRLHERIGRNDFAISALPAGVREWVERKQPYAVLIEDSFPESGNLGGWTVADRNAYIDLVARTLNREGIELAVKVHPSSQAETIRPSNPRVLAYQSESLDDLLYHSRFCITHFSTAVNQAVLLDKPILRPLWGKSAGLIDFFVKRRVSVPWENPEVLPDIGVDAEGRESYKQHHITILSPTSTHLIVGHVVS